MNHRRIEMELGCIVVVVDTEVVGVGCTVAVVDTGVVVLGLVVLVEDDRRWRGIHPFRRCSELFFFGH